VILMAVSILQHQSKTLQITPQFLKQDLLKNHKNCYNDTGKLNGLSKQGILQLVTLLTVVMIKHWNLQIKQEGMKTLLTR